MSDKKKPPTAEVPTIDPLRATGFNLVGDTNHAVFIFNRVVYRPNLENKMTNHVVFGPAVTMPWPLFDSMLATMNQIAATREIAAKAAADDAKKAAEPGAKPTVY